MNAPASLWCENKIHLPWALIEAHRAELEARNLYARARDEKPDKSLFGGEDPDQAREHFTFHFKSSAARVEFVLLNPNSIFDPISTDLAAFVIDGKVSILDIPCGSGGGLFGYLSTVAELRHQNYLPKMPLEISVLAGDISEEARSIHCAVLNRLRHSLQEVGIRIRCAHAGWDVTDPVSTTQLIDQWFAFSPDCEEYLVFISAFSGFAHKHQEKVEQALRDIAVRFYSKSLLIVWIEPDMTQSKRVFPRIIDYFKKALARFFQQDTGETKGHIAEFSYRHPFRDEDLPGRARVIMFDKR